MAKARYEFDPAKWYYATPVAVKTEELPAYSQIVRAVRVTLRTPFQKDNQEQITSSEGEAKLWMFPDDGDRTFLSDCGIDLTTLELGDTTKWLLCQFTTPQGKMRYQALAWHDELKPHQFPTLAKRTPTKRPSGLVIGQRSVTLGKRKANLTDQQVDILTELDAVHPGYVTRIRLKQVIHGWKDAGEGKMSEAIRVLRLALRPLRKVRVSRHVRGKGWCLEIPEKS